MENTNCKGKISRCVTALAGERTFLSYCRTAILTLSFGLSLGRGVGMADRLLMIVAIVVADLLLITGIVKYIKNKRAMLFSKSVFGEFSQE